MGYFGEDALWSKCGLLWRKSMIGLLWRRCTLEEIWATLEEINKIGLLWRNF